MNADQTAQDILDEACLPVTLYEDGVVTALQKAIVAAINEAVLRERERCAKIADEQAQACSADSDAGEIWVANRIATLIRRSGERKEGA